ncbi:MAG: thiamine phosphate synthase [Elusimicrobiota bacterium]
MTAPKRLSTLADVHLYCITTAPRPGQTYQDMVSAACAGGADMIQLREKAMGAKALLSLCKDLQAICDAAGALFILNDRVDVALAADVDGVHVGQGDLPARFARQMMGHRKIVGCSAHSLGQALTAQGDGADYVSCGPLFATPTKPDYKPVGLDLLRQYKEMVRIPFVAIGGIDEANAGEIVRAGADRVAVVRAVCGAADVEAAARALKEKILQAKVERERLVSHV